MYGPPYRDVYRGCLHQECKVANASLKNVHLLLQARCDPRIRHENDLNGPIHLACRRCNLQLCKMLRKAGADPSQVNGLGQTALGVACCFNCPEPRRRDHLKLVEWLLDQGVDPNHVDKGGHTALDFAASWNNLQVAALLIRRGAQVTRSSSAARHVATENDVLRGLLRAKEKKERQEQSKREEERRLRREREDQLLRDAKRRESMVKQVEERQRKRRAPERRRPATIRAAQKPFFLAALQTKADENRSGVWIKRASGCWRLAEEGERGDFATAGEANNILREAEIMYHDAEGSRFREMVKTRWRALLNIAVTR